MTTLKPVSRVTLGEQVAAQLSDQIAEGRWKPGEKLPSEAELCFSLNIGRSTLREALKSLAFVGLVQMRPGEGTYVLDGSQMIMDRILARGLPKSDKGLADVGEARLLLEGEIAALAANRADERDLEQLDAMVEDMKASLAGEGRDFIDLDVEFHLMIAQCAKNQMLFDLMAPIRGVMRDWISRSQQMPEIQQNAHKQHIKIVAAIRKRDPEKAKHEMRTHLQTCEKIYSLMERISKDAAREPAQL
jgi:GntR family transcriptional repressor for pyruvate dehydrogenase complex